MGINTGLDVGTISFRPQPNDFKYVTKSQQTIFSHLKTKNNRDQDGITENETLFWI